MPLCQGEIPYNGFRLLICKEESYIRNYIKAQIAWPIESNHPPTQ